MLDPRSFSRRLLAWYDRAKRDLPWRLAAGAAGPLDPYHVLLSETMLQQTQVATVIPYFHRFLERFPSLISLSKADEQEVLRLWQGLGYYSRARNLLKLARTVAEQFNGQIPSDIEGLLSLPGVGRYTAGAIASIAFEVRAPILDGNVQRVLCRLDALPHDPRERETNAILWRRAEEILPNKRVGDFNSALMELGATVCTPRSPQCLLCPVQKHCQAFAAGKQEQIPPPKVRRASPWVLRKTYCIARENRWLIEKRPDSGRWAGMWQFITVAQEDDDSLADQIEQLQPIGRILHTLTHRRYRFDVFVGMASNSNAFAKLPASRRWASFDELHQYPLPVPHLKIVELLRSLDAAPSREGLSKNRPRAAQS